MTGPKRIQLRRTKGWRKPDDAVVVSRPSQWGNPFTIASCIEQGFADTTETARIVCTEAFEGWLKGDSDLQSAHWAKPRERILADLHELAGRDLGCWCPLDQPCHADVLLTLANEVTA